jgi:hypothetical protein
MLLLLSAARAALTQPEILLAGEQPIAVTIPVSDGELCAAELTPDRRINATTAQRRRLVDLYQAGLIEQCIEGSTPPNVESGSGFVAWVDLWMQAEKDAQPQTSLRPAGGLGGGGLVYHPIRPDQEEDGS